MLITENDKRALEESGLFDGEWYLRQNPDVAMLQMDPLAHYLWLGIRLNRSPGPAFDAHDYLKRYQDVANHKINPLLHYLRHGKKEGRKPLPPNEEIKIHNHPAINRVKAIRHPGRQPTRDGRPVVMLCSHVAGDKLFGSELSFLDMLIALRDLEYNVIVTIPGSRNPNYLSQLLDNSIAVYDLSYGWWRKGNPINENTIACFADIIAEENVDVVHSNTIILREPLIAAKRMGIRSVIHVRELIRQDDALLELIGEPADSIIEQVWNRCDTLIANSNATLSDYRISGREASLVYNTVDFDCLSKLPLPTFDGDLRIGLISSNLPKKGIFDLAAIAKLLEKTNPRLKFFLIGPENSHTEELSRQIEAGELPSTLHILGYRSRPSDAIKEVDVVVSLSRFQESFGRTVLEGMAAGRPVLVYDHGAPPEFVENGQTGVVIPALDIAAASAALIDFDVNRAKLAHMSQAARASAEAKFGHTAYLAQMRSAYQNVLSEEKAFIAEKSTLRARRETAQSSRDKLKVAYFCWHFPVPSETFVLNELRLLRESGIDVRVFCKQSPHADFKPDFDIEWERVRDADHLAERLKETNRNIVHAHFIYPTVTNMVWPACRTLDIPFTCIAHAQDIFRYTNDKQNKIGDISRDPLCRAVFTLSRFHRDYLVERNVDQKKIIINSNCIDPSLFAGGKVAERPKRLTRNICAVSRFATKKGLDRLIRAGKLLQNDGITINIYGYGELKEEYLKIIEENNIYNVNIMAPVDTREDLLSIFKRHDLFACPSVRALDGDMDGIPTTLMEAIAAGLPVLTTDIAGIPDLVTDGLTGLVAEATPQALAQKIKEYYAMPDNYVESIIINAEARLRRNHNGPDLVETLARVWNSETIDLMMVTWNNMVEVQHIVERIYNNTSLPFHLIICDNGSDKKALSQLIQFYSCHENITLVLNRENSMVGPGTNICLEQGKSDYAIYICGKEGMVTQHGWEKPIVNYMNNNRDVGLGGTLCYSPSYLTGKDYPIGQRLWDNFRNQTFALNNPDRVFKHVQGGFFVVRRSMFEEIGGFSDDVPHGSTDVEFSYFVESSGWKLGEVPGMMALFNKTRPSLFHRIDEQMGALHPPMLEDMPYLDAIATSKVDHCVLCGKSCDSFQKIGLEALCPSCGSDRRSRSIYRTLANSILLYRRLPALAVGLPVPLKDFWEAQFQGTVAESSEISTMLTVNGKSEIRTARLDLVLINDDGLGISDSIIKEAARVLKPGGTILISGAESLEATTEKLTQSGFGNPILHRYASAISYYDWIPVIEAQRSMDH